MGVLTKLWQSKLLPLRLVRRCAEVAFIARNITYMYIYIHVHQCSFIATKYCPIMGTVSHNACKRSGK